jgi:hypothetical protein
MLGLLHLLKNEPRLSSFFNLAPSITNPQTQIPSCKVAKLPTRSTTPLDDDSRQQTITAIAIRSSSPFSSLFQLHQETSNPAPTTDARRSTPAPEPPQTCSTRHGWRPQVPGLRLDLYSFSACRPSYAISYVFIVTSPHRLPVSATSELLAATGKTAPDSDSTFHFQIQAIVLISVFTVATNLLEGTHSRSSPDRADADVVPSHFPPTSLRLASCSDLLSRHVNKCHSNDKKSGGATGRVRKHRPTQSQNPIPPPTNPPPPPQPQPVLHPHQRQPQFTHSDPFHPGPHLYTPQDAYPPRAFDSASHPSSASVSLDNLTTGLPYALPNTVPNYPPRLQNAYPPGYRQTTATTAAPTQFEHSIASTQSVADGCSSYK